MTIWPSADPSYVWTPQMFSQMVERVVTEEIRAIAAHNNREPDDQERNAITQVVMGSIMAQLTPAGNA